ncbi:hypothetical protein D3C81_1955330 [compost metagenome]
MKIRGVNYRGDRFRRCQLHLIIDIFGFTIQRTPEDPGEAQYIVDLVRVVGTPRRHYSYMWRSDSGIDFRRWIRHGEHNGILGHIEHIFQLQHIGCGNPDKYIRPFDYIR